MDERLKKISRVGFLGLTSPAAHAQFLEAFRRGLRDLGYMDGESVWVEYRLQRRASTIGYPSLQPISSREKVDLVVNRSPG